jgi:hypothetical protein
MKKDRIKKLKALALLIVFSLNTVVGFACSVGLDMGFNNGHHHKEASKNNHHHEAELKSLHQHSHTDSKGHHHEQLVADHHCLKTSRHTPKNEKDNCCKDEVIKFAKADKQTTRSIEPHVPAFILAVIVPSYPSFEIIASGIHKPNKWYFVQCHHPPIDDIRIAIQSFQI